jgi:hypothetical protein
MIDTMSLLGQFVYLGKYLVLKLKPRCHNLTVATLSSNIFDHFTLLPLPHRRPLLALPRPPALPLAPPFPLATMWNLPKQVKIKLFPT